MNTPKKIAFCTGITYPSKMANRVHVLAMVKAFSDLGCKVNFYGKSIQDFTYKNVNIVNCNRKSFIIAFLQLKDIKKNGADFIYVREPRLWLFLTLYNRFIFRLKIPIIYEKHNTPQEFIGKVMLPFLFKYTHRLIVITHGLKKRLVKKYHLKEEKIVVLPDAVDIELYANVAKEKVEELYRRHKIPRDKKNVVYIGHLYEWKGAHVLAQTASLLKDTCNVIFVGGWEDSVVSFKEKYASLENVYILGHVPHKETPMYMQLADVLVLPNSGKTDISKKYTSPIKMFEYMASKRPIVASDLPSIREILTEGRNAFLVEPDNPKTLAEGIQKALTTDTTKITDQDFQDVQEYTWEKRAKKIIELI